MATLLQKYMGQPPKSATVTAKPATVTAPGTDAATRRPRAKPYAGRTELVGRVEQPGSPGGPCPDCLHTCCILLRAAAETRCTACHQPIGYDVRYIETLAGIRHDPCGTQAIASRRPIRRGVKGQWIELRPGPPKRPHEDLALESLDVALATEEEDATVRAVVAGRLK